MTRLREMGGAFDLIVDRGLLMSLFGERARRAYAATLIRLTADGGSHYQYQWVLPRDPRMLTPGWLATKVKGFVTAPHEIEYRFGDAFVVEQLSRSIEPTDDPGIQEVARASTAPTRAGGWLQRGRGSDRR